MSRLLKKNIDVKLLKYLTLFYTFLTLISLIKKSYFKNLEEGRFTSYSWFELIAYNVFLDWLVVIIFMTFISILTKKMFDKNLSVKVIASIHLILSFFIGYFIFFTTSLILYITGYYTTIDFAMTNVTFRHFMIVVDLNFLFYFAMLGIIYSYYYTKRIKNIEIQKATLQTQLISTKMNVLKSQLHPHFVFNTLNSISSLIEIDTEKSQNLIADFGDLFRGILEIKDEHLIPLEKDLSLLDKYIDIISVRFSDHLTIKKNIENGIKNTLVPNMIIQPLIENAIKHGYSYHKTELIIELSIYKKSNYLIIVIKNDGKLLDKTFNQLIKKGFGLKNTQERLQTLFNADFEFIIRNNKDNSGVEAFIKFPATI